MGSPSGLPASVQAFIDHEISTNQTDFSDLRAVIVNGTLKRSPAQSHTEGLTAIASHILTGVGATVDMFRTVDHTIPPGVATCHDSDSAASLEISSVGRVTRV